MNLKLQALYCLFLALAAMPALADTVDNCHIGSYRLADGSAVDVAPSDGNTLRWRRFDGETGALHPAADGKWTSTYGWTGRSDGKTVTFSGCADGKINFNGVAGRRISFDVSDTKFQSHGTTLVGRLILPPGDGKVPVVVLVHGSEQDSALTWYSLQRMLPAEGVGAFVYDKRGTGKSGGQYTQDFSVLADDVVAAVAEARRLAGPRLGRIGLHGGSEGGWVAPIAANRTRLDFVIVAFGLAVNVIDEDQESIQLQMREKGYSAEIIAKAQEVGHFTENLFVSDFQEGFEEFDEMRARYGREPWFKDVQGDFSGLILSQPDAKLRGAAKDYDWHTPFYYDPMPTLRADSTPQLWILGGEDYEAPSEETSMRIKSLVTDGLPYTLALYPHAEHGITLFETDAKGERLSTRYAPGYFAMIRDFARDGRIGTSYGDAQLTFSCSNRH